MRVLHTLLALPVGALLHAQVSFNVLAPEGISGGYPHTWAAPAAGGWATPDMELAQNRVVGDLALALDASVGDSLACGALVNGAAVNGKVALIYRGTCDYSVKALNAQQAGAIAVVIVNNVAGDPVGMGAGGSGTSVTIPVFQVSNVTGALLRGAMNDGPVTVLLGDKMGFFAADIGLLNRGILLPPALSMPTWLAANPGEYTVRIGAYVYNLGSQPRTDAVLEATVVRGGTTVYHESSTPVAVGQGDSLFVALPDFEQNAWVGEHTLTYSASFGGTDEHALDNTYVVPFSFDSLYAMVPRDNTGMPVTTIGIMPAPAVQDYELCLHFRDANASRTAIKGVQLYASQNAPGNMQGELLISRVYEWNDVFTGLTDPQFNISSLVAVHEQEHYVQESGTFVNTYLAFDEPLVLDDDQRYMICVNTLNSAVFLGHNEFVRMDTHEEIYDQPVDPHRGASGWFIGFVGGAVNSMGVQMMPSTAIGIAERERATVAAWPNPGTGRFSLAMDNAGPAHMVITDATGRVVRTLNVSGPSHVIDLRGEAPGVYLLSIEHAKGRAVGRLVVE